MKLVQRLAFISVLFASTNVFANDTYIVKAQKGVNVRVDVLMQTQSKNQDILKEGTILVKLDEVFFNKNTKWGKFIYEKNGTKKIGWIKMNYLSKINK